MSGLRSRSVPAPGQAPLVAPNAAALLRRNAREFGDAVAIKFGDRAWTHGEYFEESCRVRRSCSTRGCHARGRGTSRCCSTTRPTTCSRSAAAGLLGAAIVGLNHTRRDEHLLRDIEHTHCWLVITEPRHEELLAPIAGRLPPVLTSTRFADGDDPPVDARRVARRRARRDAERRPRASNPTSTRSGR